MMYNVSKPDFSHNMFVLQFSTLNVHYYITCGNTVKRFYAAIGYRGVLNSEGVLIETSIVQ